jgi:hypothetical protein
MTLNSRGGESSAIVNFLRSVYILSLSDIDGSVVGFER